MRPRGRGDGAVLAGEPDEVVTAGPVAPSSAGAPGLLLLLVAGCVPALCRRAEAPKSRDAGS